MADMDKAALQRHRERLREEIAAGAARLGYVPPCPPDGGRSTRTDRMDRLLQSSAGAAAAIGIKWSPPPQPRRRATLEMQRFATPYPSAVRPVAALSSRHVPGGGRRALARAEICERLGIGRIQLWRRIRAGQFPEADVVVAGRPAWSAELVEQLEGAAHSCLSRREVCDRLGIGRIQLWRKIVTGRFPKPDVIASGRPAWSVAIMEAWQAAVDAELERDHVERIQAEIAALRAEEQFHNEMEARRHACLGWLRKQARMMGVGRTTADTMRRQWDLAAAAYEGW